MTLKLTIISEQRVKLGGHSTFVLRQSSGTIGRAYDNTWTLADPHRYLSAHHARIVFSQGAYFIEDTSTNGLFLNGSEDPVGRHGPQGLRSGDTLRLGDYMIRVTIDDSDADIAASAEYLVSPPASHFATPMDADLGADLNLNELILHEGNSYLADHSLNTPGPPPMVDDTGLRKFDVARHSPSGADTGMRRRAAAAVTMRGASEAFFRGAGIDIERIPAELHLRVLHLAGLLMREALVGVKDLARLQRELRAGSGISTEGEDAERIALQQLPVEDLLVRLFLGHERHDIDAVQWLRELLSLTRQHDTALMRALSVALADFTRHLDPAVLGTGAAQQKRFRSITDMSDQRLPHLFAEALARAFNAEFGVPGSEK
ncbi:MAG: FHA domain-containing protein [Steroidobacteraceae bacterium]|jgi:predicted component of type VI protein secretion system